MTSQEEPTIPDRVLCSPFHRPYGAMAADGVKTLETRGRPWTKPPSWLAIYNCAKIARLQEGASKQLNAATYDGSKDESVIGPDAHVIGMVHVQSSRLLLVSDISSSFFYETGRFAWILSHAVRFQDPIPMGSLGIKKGPQSNIWVPGGPLREAKRRPRRDPRLETNPGYCVHNVLLTEKCATCDKCAVWTPQRFTTSGTP